jgi:hypothetical protein
MHPLATAIVSTLPIADGTLTRESLNTFVSLLLSPFAAIASLTTFVVGFNAFVAWLSHPRGRAHAGIERAIAYGTARAFGPALIPAGFLLASTIRVYT